MPALIQTDSNRYIAKVIPNKTLRNLIRKYVTSQRIVRNIVTVQLLRKTILPQLVKRIQNIKGNIPSFGIVV